MQVLQACHTEEPVWHAAAAFGAIHRTYRDHGPEGVTSAISLGEHHDKAYRQYHKAVISLHSQLRSGDSKSMHVALIACVLLVCFDLISNRYKAALLHLRSGLGILDYSKESRKSLNGNKDVVDLEQRFGNYSIDDDLQEPFSLLEVQAIFFGIRRSRHQDWPQASLEKADPLPVNGFKNIEEARRSLEYIVECISSFVVKVDEKIKDAPFIEPVETLIEEQRLLKLRLQAWYLTAEGLLTDYPRSTDVNVTSLHVQYWADWILLSTSLDKGREVMFDNHIKDFRRIVELIEVCMRLNRLPTFSINYSLIPALYYTAMKCRDPSIRRQAINLLHSQHWREGMWESSTGAFKSAWLMAEEERGLSHVECAADIPEQSRIHQSMLVPRQGEKPVVVYRRRRHESDGKWITFNAGSREEFVSGNREREVDVAHWKL
ncbi:MAG: hypothetical protein Q9162_005133 [Coniocarpon cinnabarinum]